MVSGLGGARQLSVILTLQDRMSKQLVAARAQVDRFGAATTKTGRNIDTEFKKANVSVGRFLLTLRSNILAVVAVAAAGIAIVASFVGAALQQRTATLQLDGALQAVGTSWREQKERIESVMDALNEKTGFSDVMQIEALKQLVLQTRNFEAAMGLLEPALGFAARTGLSVVDSANLIGAVLRGEDGAIRQAELLGVNFNSTGTEAERLNGILEFTGGWAEKNRTAVSELSAKWHDFMVKVGEELLPTLEPLLDLLIAMIPALEALARVVMVFVQQITGPLQLLMATINAVNRLLGRGEERPITSVAQPGPIQYDPSNDVPLPPAGFYPQPAPPKDYGDPYIPPPPGLSVNIISNGDLDLERRVLAKLDSLYQRTWRPNG